MLFFKTQFKYFFDKMRAMESFYLFWHVIIFTSHICSNKERCYQADWLTEGILHSGGNKNFDKRLWVTKW